MIENEIKSIDSLDFEEAIKELEDIISKLEGDSLTLEESMKLYKRGIILSHHCNQKLERAQGEIRILSRNQNGVLEELPFEISEEGNEGNDI